MDIIDEIKKKLCEIEREENVEVLFAIESGSRAWGFASPDSDYDVRFIYKHKMDFYLKLDKRRDVIECTPDKIYDINGWDLDKTFKLLYSSNPTLFEWIISPIVYKTTEFHKSFQKLAPDYFLHKSSLYHYLSMAKNNYRVYLKGDTVRLKKYFYVLRPILACRWILKNSTQPPMLFQDLVGACLEPELHETIRALLKWKMSAPESEHGPRIDTLNAWIELNIAAIETNIATLPDDNTKDMTVLNEIFLSEIMKSQ